MFKRSISSILLLSVSAAILVGVLVLILYVAQSSRHMALSLEEQAMVQLAEQTTKTLSNHLDSLRSQAKSLAGLEAMRSALEWGEGRQAQAAFQAVLKNQDWMWSALAFDLTGKVVAGCNAKGGDLTGGDRSDDRDYVKASWRTGLLRVPQDHRGKTRGRKPDDLLRGAAVREQAGATSSAGGSVPSGTPSPPHPSWTRALRRARLPLHAGRGRPLHRRPCVDKRPAANQDACGPGLRQGRPGLWIGAA
jgi:hypothetical protein